MYGSVAVRQDTGRRSMAAIATVAVHVAIVALLLLAASRPRPVDDPAPTRLLLVDIARPPEPPLRPVTAAPVQRESLHLRPTAGGGSPRKAAAPLARQAAPAAVTPVRFDRVELPAPAADIGADLPLPVGISASDGRGTGMASGLGKGGEGLGTGQGRGDGDGPGEGRLRLAWAEWIKKPSQDQIDEAFPKMARLGGVSGVAVLLCIVPKPGRPQSCTVAAERPGKRGFGEAALALYPQFRIRPVMKGSEVVQAEVLVPVTFTVRR